MVCNSTSSYSVEQKEQNLDIKTKTKTKSMRSRSPPQWQCRFHSQHTASKKSPLVNKQTTIQSKLNHMKQESVQVHSCITLLHKIKEKTFTETKQHTLKLYNRKKYNGQLAKRNSTPIQTLISRQIKKTRKGHPSTSKPSSR